MIKPPKTSIELLQALGNDATSARWQEFVNLYLPMLQEYCRVKFPNLDADDIIQETFVALVKILPNYKYDPETTGYFHSYLRKVLRNKAVDILRKEVSNKRRIEGFVKSVDNEYDASTEAEFLRLMELSLSSSEDDKKEDDASVESAIVNIALSELNNNPNIHELTKIIFKEIAIEGKKPEEVAEAHGIKRNAVDQIRARMVAQLKKIIASLDPENL